MAAHLIDQFESLIRRDPARRGLISSEPLYGPLCPRHLAGAASHLAAYGESVAIATGFFIPRGDPPTAETDGPLGTLLLAQALQQAGIPTTVLTDPPCLPAVTAAARAMHFPLERIWACPPSGEWVEQFYLTGPGRDLTHLIALERVGPSHTPESLAAQSRLGPAPLTAFLEKVPPEDFDRCHNMRGEIIDASTCNLHLAFERLSHYRPHARTIGIGDGGNEIGMGCIPWEELERRLDGPQSGKVPCRIATDWNIVAGTSNWGGYALAAATLLLRGRVELLGPYGREQQQGALEYLVAHGPAVDGVTRRREATVDGLPFLTYIQPWEGIRHLLGWEA